MYGICKDVWASAAWNYMYLRHSGDQNSGNEHQFGNFHFHHIPRAYKLQMIFALCFFSFFLVLAVLFLGGHIPNLTHTHWYRFKQQEFFKSTSWFWVGAMPKWVQENMVCKNYEGMFFQRVVILIPFIVWWLYDCEHNDENCSMFLMFAF